MQGMRPRQLEARVPQVQVTPRTSDLSFLCSVGRGPCQEENAATEERRGEDY